MKAALALALLAAAAASAPAALADQAEIDRLEAQLEGIDARYGFPPPPDLTAQQWEDYYAEAQAAHDQAASSYERLEEMWRQYEEITDEIAELDAEGAAIDARYGIEPLPVLTQEQWDAHGAATEGILRDVEEAWRAIDGLWRDIDDFWDAYDAELESDAEAEPDEERLDGYRADIDEQQELIDGLYARLDAVDAEYGFPAQPVLTPEQWDRYVAEIDAVEASKVPYFERLESVQLPYRGDLDAVEAVGEQIRAIDARYGIDNEPPDLTPEQWDQYHAETDPINAQISALEAVQDVERRAAFESAGIMMPTGDDEEFFEEFGRLVQQYPQITMIGDSSVAQDQKASLYADLEAASPAIKEVFERHGYGFPLLSAEQFKSLDEKLLGIG